MDAVCIIFLQGITAVACVRLWCNLYARVNSPTWSLRCSMVFAVSETTGLRLPSPSQAKHVCRRSLSPLCAVFSPHRQDFSSRPFSTTAGYSGPTDEKSASSAAAFAGHLKPHLISNHVLSGRVPRQGHLRQNIGCLVCPAASVVCDSLLSTAPQDVTSVSLITLLSRVTLGLCPTRGWLPFVGNVVHWILAVKQVAVPLQSDVFLAQSAELVLLFSGVFPLRHALYENVRMSFELNTRTIELSAVSGLLLGYCDAVVRR